MNVWSSALWGLSFTALVAFSACKTTDPAADGETGTGDAGTDDGIATLDDGEDVDTGDGDGDTTTTGDGDGDGDTTTTGDGDGDTGTPGECGNGVHEFGEECDDGNLDDGDGCSSTCTWESGPLPCGNKTYQCGDEIDNDMDGFTDMDDSECISPCDDSEASFETNLPGQNEDCKSDCYWDQDSGVGNDNCEWNLKCDPENSGAQIGCEYDPDYGPCDVMLPQQCLDVCVPLVPNGCDCFGCCEIDGQFVYLAGAECTLENLDACESCTFYEDCNNPCVPEDCELCFGDDPEDLPEECGEPTCPDDLQPCLDTAECEEGWFCQTGCCVPIIVE